MRAIDQYRQPMVTATGIYLGFMLNFTSVWITTAFSKHLVRDLIVAVSTAFCIALLLTVLFRILRMNYPKDVAEQYYSKTLRLFLVAVSIPFLAFIFIMIEKFIIKSSGMDVMNTGTMNVGQCAITQST